MYAVLNLKRQFNSYVHRKACPHRHKYEIEVNDDKVIFKADSHYQEKQNNLNEQQQKNKTKQTNKQNNSQAKAIS